GSGFCARSGGQCRGAGTPFPCGTLAGLLPRGRFTDRRSLLRLGCEKKRGSCNGAAEHGRSWERGSWKHAEREKQHPQNQNERHSQALFLLPCPPGALLGVSASDF